MSQLVSFLINTGREEKGNTKDEERREKGGSHWKHYYLTLCIFYCVRIENPNFSFRLSVTPQCKKQTKISAAKIHKERFQKAFEVAATDMKFFARSKLSKSFVHKKQFGLIWQLVFKLGFCKGR